MRQTPPVKSLRDGQWQSAFRIPSADALFLFFFFSSSSSFSRIINFTKEEKTREGNWKKEKELNLNNKCIHLSGRVFIISASEKKKKTEWKNLIQFIFGKWFFIYLFLLLLFRLTWWPGWPSTWNRTASKSICGIIAGTARCTWPPEPDTHRPLPSWWLTELTSLPRYFCFLSFFSQSLNFPSSFPSATHPKNSCRLSSFLKRNSIIQIRIGFYLLRFSFLFWQYLFFSSSFRFGRRRWWSQKETKFITWIIFLFFYLK